MKERVVDREKKWLEGDWWGREKDQKKREIQNKSEKARNRKREKERRKESREENSVTVMKERKMKSTRVCARTRV